MYLEEYLRMERRRHKIGGKFHYMFMQAEIWGLQDGSCGQLYRMLWTFLAINTEYDCLPPQKMFSSKQFSRLLRIVRGCWMVY